MTLSYRSLLVTVMAGVCGLAPLPAFASTAYVILGEEGRPVARVLTEADHCPTVRADRRDLPMTVRREPGTVAQRPTASAVEFSKPSAFPVLTCELALPTGTRSATVDGHRLPLPRARLNRIVVIGDTGCRLKATDAAYQPCNDPAAYPFARISARAAAWRPDAVIHVGDLLYRENPCPDSEAGCAGTPWGFGYDAWKADFFDPAAPLLAAAPWIMTRGNHESCARGGQGWWRFIDPRPPVANQTCDRAADDATGDYSAPFAVPLGGGAQVVVMDLSGIGGRALATDDPRRANIRQSFAELDRLGRQARFTFALDHYPVLSISADDKNGIMTLQPGNGAIQSVIGAPDGGGLPDSVDVLLAGHVHLFEQASFSSAHPSQFVTGFSGTLEDKVPLPETLPEGASAGMGSVVEQFSSWVDGFGYMTLERRGVRSWAATIRDVDGHVVNRCRIDGRRSSCRVKRVPSPATAPPR